MYQQQENKIIMAHGTKHVTFVNNRQTFNFRNIIFPDTVKEIYFIDEFDQSIDGINFNKIEYIKFGGKFNQILDNVVFSNSIKKIEFGGHYNQSLDNVKFPLSLKQLTINKLFNKSLHNIIFSSPVHLIIKSKFPKSIVLPKNIISITFENNVSIDDVIIPDLVQNIRFGHEFNQPINNVKLPIALQSIIFGWKFSQSLNDVKFPKSLKNITFEGEYPKSLTNVILPDELQTFRFRNLSFPLLNLPSSLKKIYIDTTPYFKFIVPDDIINNIINKSKIPYGCEIYYITK